MTRKKNSLKKSGVIVIGGHIQGLGITRIFGKNGIPVILLDKKQINLAKHSKYCREFFNYKTGELLKMLMYLGKQERYKNWLLMPTGDEDVGILGENKKELSKYFKVSTEDSNVLQYFFNKRDSYKLASALNIPIPTTWMPNDWNEIKSLNITYPCIIKPAVIHTFYKKAKKKVFVCNNKDELKVYYDKAISIIPKEEIIIQDIVPGNSEHQYSVCFMFDGKNPLVTLSARRARQHPPDFGNATTYAETVDIPEIVSYAKKILSKINYTGVCEVEFKFDYRDNTYRFLEVNPRTWKWHAMAEKSNSPILMSLYHHTYNLQPIIKNNQTKASFRHLLTDLPTIIKMKYLNIDYPKTKKNTYYAVWQRDDLLPAVFEILYLPYFIVNR